MTFRLPIGVSRKDHVGRLAARVQRLRAEGLSFAVIAIRLGVSQSTAGKLARVAAPAERAR